MKKYIYIIMCIGWFGFTEIQAQRCLPKQTGIEIKGGFVDGFHAGKSDHTAFYGGLFRLIPKPETDGLRVRNI